VRGEILSFGERYRFADANQNNNFGDVQQKPCRFYWHGLLHITIRAPTLAPFSAQKSIFGSEGISIRFRPENRFLNSAVEPE
ncbi:MAG: hypothetical protein ACK5Y6_04890, partial [Pseudomonadota bacterium]